MFECSKGHKYSVIAEGGHSPLQSFLGAWGGFANTSAHLPQFCPSLFGRGIDVCGYGLGSFFS
jgi:hypothetical protein